MKRKHKPVISQVAKIKIDHKQLGMDDASYRSMMPRVTGKRSATELTVTEQHQVLAELVRLGFRPKPVHKGKTYSRPTSRKLVMLWQDLYQTGHVSNRSNAALCQWVSRQTGKGSPDWLEPAEAARLIEALKAWLERPFISREESDADT